MSETYGTPWDCSQFSCQPKTEIAGCNAEMVTSARPNKYALHNALDIYLYAMRPFVVRCLKRVKCKRVDEVIAETLRDRRVILKSSIRESVEDTFDITDLPILVCRHWAHNFEPEFNFDRRVQDILWAIKKARNKVAHPTQQDIERDIDGEFARSRLSDIADMLGRINRPDDKRAVEEIRDGLSRLEYPDGVVVAPESEDEAIPVELLTDRPMARVGYWVYEDRPTSRTRIHKSTCRFCNDGKGLHGSRLPDNKWHGPFESEENAIGIALDTGHSDISGCGSCLPDL